MDDFDLPNLSLISTESTSRTSSKVNSVVLEETKCTRKTLQSTIVTNLAKPEACININIIHERAGKNGFEAVESLDLRKLKLGECHSYSLNSKETLELFKALSKLYAIGKDIGVEYGNHQYIVLKISGEMNLSEADEKGLSQLLKTCQNSPGLADKLATVNSELIEKAYLCRLLQKKREGLVRFKIMMNEAHKEQEWQDFFEEHDWILGGVYEIQFLGKIANQPIMSGANVFGLGEKRSDILLGSQGNARFTAVAEIKKPQTDILKPTPYRNGIFSPSDELNGGLAQLRTYMRKWQIEGSRTEINKDLLEAQKIYTIQPRGILIIGNLTQIEDNREKREAFELFRQNQKDVHIITFDEVYYRAQAILGEINPAKLST